MNERLVISLMLEGQHVPITSLSASGVTINNEEDSWPSGLVFEFGTDHNVTRYRMDRVRQINGWESHQFKLDYHLENGDLVFTGVKANSLPFGTYWFRVRIADQLVSNKKFRVTIPEDGESVQDVPIKRDPRQVQLLGDVSTFDSQIARVLRDPESRIDGIAVSAWLDSPKPRARRKACLLNLLAKLRSAPTAGTSLIQHVRYVFFADVDRIYAALDAEYYNRLVSLSKDPSKPFYAEGAPTDSGHRKLLQRVKKFESSADKFQLQSFRQEGKNSFQSVVAIPPEGAGFSNYYADIDIDLGNPLQDLQGFVIHIGELLDPGTTDHLAIYKKLTGDKKVSPFLYYKVVTK